MENNCNGTEDVEVKSGTSPVTPGEGQGETTAQSVTNEPKVEKTSQVVDSVTSYGKTLWETVLSIWKNPLNGITNYLKADKAELSYGMVGIQAVLLVIIACIVLKRVYHLFFDTIGGIMSLWGGKINLPYGKTIVAILILSILAALIYAAITMAIMKAYAKTDCTYKKGFMIYGVRLAAILPFLLVALIFSIFSIKLAVLIIILGELLANVYVQTAVQCSVPQNDEREKYTSYLVIGLNFIAFLLLCYFYFKL